MGELAIASAASSRQQETQMGNYTLSSMLDSDVDLGDAPLSPKACAMAEDTIAAKLRCTYHGLLRQVLALLTEQSVNCVKSLCIVDQHIGLVARLSKSTSTTHVDCVDLAEFEERSDAVGLELFLVVAERLAAVECSSAPGQSVPVDAPSLEPTCSDPTLWRWAAPSFGCGSATHEQCVVMGAGIGSLRVGAQLELPSNALVASNVHTMDVVQISLAARGDFSAPDCVDLLPPQGALLAVLVASRVLASSVGQSAAFHWPAHLVPGHHATSLCWGRDSTGEGRPTSRTQSEALF